MKKERQRISSGGSTSSGKGDRARTVDQDAYHRGYAEAFGRCTDHPKYKVLRKPKADCVVCRRLWREKELGL